MKEIIRRFEYLLWEKDIPDKKYVENLYQKMVPAEIPGTWRWEDVNYEGRERSTWSAADHYKRIRLILKGFGRQRMSEDEEYTAKMTGALKYWLINDFINPNWWLNEIGMPQNIGDIAIMMSPVLDKETLTRATELVSRGSMAKNGKIAADWTGANLIWGALNTIRHALLTEDEQLLHIASRRISQEITVGSEDGIQEDYSFFQHGARLYSGGYGRDFIYELSIIIFLLNKTDFALPGEKTDIILSFLLDGLRFMTQKDSLDWACVGRELVRMNATNVGLVRNALEFILETQDLPRKNEIKAFLESMRGGAQPDMTKYFEKAFILCHHFDGIYVGAKFMNNRLLGAEVCNAEGELCYNMSYGTHTCIMRNGAEYRNIFPVWDYSRVPGTTSRPETDEQLRAHEGWETKTLSNDHSGGQQQGQRAMIYELAEHDDIKMLVTDFAFENGFVSLGTEIGSERSNPEGIVTTVDQCLLQGEVVVENNSVIHNGIRYTALLGTHIEVTIEKKCGSWHRNSRDLSDNPVSADVVTLTINPPVEGRYKYAYMISAADKLLPNVEIIQNDCDIQSIRLPDGSGMSAFHRL